MPADTRVWDGCPTNPAQLRELHGLVSTTGIPTRVAATHIIEGTKSKPTRRKKKKKKPQAPREEHTSGLAIDLATAFSRIRE